MAVAEQAQVFGKQRAFRIHANCKWDKCFCCTCTPDSSAMTQIVCSSWLIDPPDSCSISRSACFKLSALQLILTRLCHAVPQRHACSFELCNIVASVLQCLLTYAQGTNAQSLDSVNNLKPCCAYATDIFAACISC